jgi:acyl-CoA synthetase (AMP-forming)/AMP-acid ligase II
MIQQDVPMRSALQTIGDVIEQYAVQRPEWPLRVVRTDSRLIPSDIAAFRTTALILKTSGTTGTAKLVRVTHRNLLAMASKMRQWFNLSAEDRCACFLPTYYAQGYKSALRTAHPRDDVRPRQGCPAKLRGGVYY